MINDAKAWLANPWTWFATGAGAGLNVWYAQLRPDSANLTLVVGAAFIATGVFFLPSNAAHPRLRRLISPCISFGVMFLIVRYTLWTPLHPLNLSARTSAATQPPGTKIGGIEWTQHFAEIHVMIQNPSSLDYEDLDLLIRADQPITAVGQLSNLSSISVAPYGVPTVMPEFVDLATGRREAFPVSLLATTGGYRLRTDLLPRRTAIEMVMAAVTIPAMDRDVDSVDSVAKVTLASGESFWFAPDGHSNRVFGGKPKVSSVSVTGQYIADGRENSISVPLSVVDYLDGAVDAVLQYRGERARQDSQ